MKEKQKMENLANKNQSKSAQPPQEFKNGIQGLENNLERTAHNTGERLGAMASNFADSASEYVRTGRGYVKENPAKGVAIAAAVGVVAGSLITIAMRRRD